MTAQVGVMNRIAVSLAADSAVSLGRDAGKTYTSADKLFQLSNSAPVGIMVYGNADFLRLPWEVLVKEYRRRLEGQRFDTVQEYADDFFSFLRDSEDVLDDEGQQQQDLGLVYSLLVDVREVLRERLDDEAEKCGGVTEEDVTKAAGQVIRERLERIKAHDRISTITNAEVGRIRKRFREPLKEPIKEVFGELPLSPQSKKDLRSIAIEMLTRTYFGPLQCGVVFAGFGEREFMPSLYSYALEEMVCGHLRIAEPSEQKITRRNGAAIIPFAQQEMVHSFLRGLDPSIQAHIRSSTAVAVSGLTSSITGTIEESVGDIPTEVTNAVHGELEGALRSLFERWDSTCATYWQPVVEIVSSLPKDELGSMAEALVNLTKFRRRITPERETVGGPIDVAIITKGDGFVWVRRKHYFRSELNPRIMAQYHKQQGEE